MKIKLQKGSYAVDVAITRYYRIWKHADEDEERSHFAERVKLAIVEDQDKDLELDPDLDIEYDDIQNIWVDEDSLQLDYDDEEGDADED